jgi:hypothetical protein
MHSWSSIRICCGYLVLKIVVMSSREKIGTRKEKLRKIEARAPISDDLLVCPRLGRDTVGGRYRYPFCRYAPFSK